MLVVYKNYYEVLICQSDTERGMLSTWFSAGGRTLSQYTRDEYQAGMLAIRPQANVSGVGETPGLPQ